MATELTAIASEGEDPTTCSFCGRTADEVGEQPVEGPAARICRECTEAAAHAFTMRDEKVAKGHHNMPERSYTVGEIERMREAIRHRLIWGHGIKETPPSWQWQEGAAGTRFRSSASFNEVDLTKRVEEHLRTYMLAGIEPTEIEGRREAEPITTAPPPPA